MKKYSRESEPTPIKDMEDFQSSVQASVHLELNAFIAYDRARQGENQTVAEFSTYLFHLEEYLTAEVDEMLKIQYFIRRLRPEIQNHVSFRGVWFSRRPLTSQDAENVDVARRIEQLKRSYEMQGFLKRLRQELRMDVFKRSVALTTRGEAEFLAQCIEAVQLGEREMQRTEWRKRKRVEQAVTHAVSASDILLFARAVLIKLSSLTMAKSDILTE
ncbi:hypothetical protein M501DRAFT_1033208 [Patellaria atrata CBS 101060]|uniref:Uncharacterized protein n=1 Tax=Patellaria atrata CBS 101060 TaxID=1346257 RepID=A0A9P4VMU1_9PEZI|nr:hypothetical protein M501DRAFT_1033208 [Patellaria atrata CBS 101060]